MPIQSSKALKESLLAWAADFDYAVFLDSCNTSVDQYGEYEFILGVADRDSEVCQSWGEVVERVGSNPGVWWFGCLSYDAKNELEPKLSSTNPTIFPFPNLIFFQAETVIYQRRGEHHIESFPDYSIHLAKDKVLSTGAIHLDRPLKSNFTKEEYLETVETVRGHIYEGDSYEINLSQSFHTTGDIQSPAAVWRRLTEVSPTPFAAYARFSDTHLLCASPERFLQLRGERLITQPIKGTTHRDPDPGKDRKLAIQLRNSLKEQAENIMIVDLSRNDLYRSSVVNGVTVPELYGIQSFSKVHHLVSTIEAIKSPDVSGLDTIARTFPPGSMTGAPKFRSCELIEKYERHSRGMYAGSVGYFTPDGDFDLNVVIRSMIWHEPSRVLTYHVGGAITWDSNPESEYKETLSKAQAIKEILG